MKSLLWFLLSCAVGMAAPITTTTLNCYNVGCNGPDTFATASIEGMSVSATAQYVGTGSPAWITANAVATLDDDLTLTVHGGNGMAMVTPCLYTSPLETGSTGATASAIVSFGSYVTVSGCRSGSSGIAVPFDTPTSFHLHLMALAAANDIEPHGAGAVVAAGFYGLRVDPGVTYSLVETGSVFSAQSDANAAHDPEPASVLLVGSAIGLLLALRRSRKVH